MAPTKGVLSTIEDDILDNIEGGVLEQCLLQHVGSDDESEKLCAYVKNVRRNRSESKQKPSNKHDPSNKSKPSNKLARSKPPSDKRNNTKPQQEKKYEEDDDEEEEDKKEHSYPPVTDDIPHLPSVPTASMPFFSLPWPSTMSMCPGGKPESDDGGDDDDDNNNNNNDDHDKKETDANPASCVDLSRISTAAVMDSSDNFQHCCGAFNFCTVGENDPAFCTMQADDLKSLQTNTAPTTRTKSAISTTTTETATELTVPTSNVVESYVIETPQLDTVGQNNNKDNKDTKSQTSGRKDSMLRRLIRGLGRLNCASNRRIADQVSS